jgi:hypothetical protein
MNNIFLVIIFSIISPILSFKEIKPKICINCRHFIKDNNNDDSGKFAKCSLFPLKNENTNKWFLVNGIKEKEIVDYQFCVVARKSDEMCGNKGTMHKRKYNKKG